MKRTLEAGKADFPAPPRDPRELLRDVLINLFPHDQQWASSFGQPFDIREIQLGEELLSYPANNTTTNQIQSFADQNLYLVCQGRVRLISYDVTQQRDVSTVLLDPSETFGLDEQFLEKAPVLSYRAIAATATIVATLSLEKLTPWLQQQSQLQSYLQEQTFTRQRLIFLKTATNLRSHSSHALKQILPYLTERIIPAGANLAQVTPSHEGSFWLRSGEIQAQDQPPKIGDRWGFPDAIPADWIAATTLQVYQLSAKHWETVQAIAPGLSAVPTKASQSPVHRAIARSANPSRVLHSDSQMVSSDRPAIAIQPAPDSKIEFARPIKQRNRAWFGRSYPFIPQQSSADCGATCLAMIAQYWGKRLNLNTLRNLAGVGRSGASLKGLAHAAENLGFQARPVRSSFNRIAEQTMPWIAHWQGDHYVVVYRVNRNRVLVADPGLGKRSLTATEFQASWTGYALLLTPTESLKAVPSSKPSLGKFWGAFLPYQSMLLPIIIATVLLQVFGVVTPLFTQIILDQVVVHKSLPTLHVFIIGLLMFGFWRIGLVCIRQYLLDYFSNQVDLTLISGFISHTLNLPLQFFATRHVGDIVTRVQENQKIQSFLTRQAIGAWLDAIMAVFYVGLMLHYNLQLALLVLALLPPIIILTVIASPFLRRISRQIFHEAAKQNSSLVEMLTGIATVKATGAERDLRWQWEDHLTSQFNAQFRGQKFSNGLQGVSSAINTLGSTALLWYGATLVIQDQLSIGQFVAFNMMIGNVIGPVLSLVGLWDEFQEVLVSVERLDDIFTATPEERPDKPLIVLPSLRGEVQFENVTFRYNADDDRNILQNISFYVSPGSTVAIVGRSGSGKTTLISLLQGLYHPNTGRITIDGNDLRHVSPQSLRHQLGVVPQECFLFSGTILDNITLYRSEYPLESVLEVAKLAEAHSFIQSLPLGYHTKVGERGTMLSGGQRQRIAIARALLSNPRILILDEATSSLDTESERRFQKNLQHISRNRTTFIIAHRLSTVRSADCILVIDRGLIVEQGTHAELMKKQGLYAQLAQQQLDL